MKPLSFKINKISILPKRKFLFFLLLCIIFGVAYSFIAYQRQETAIMVMGGSLQAQCIECEDPMEFYQRDLETFYRPSNLPILNNKIPSANFFDPYFGKKPEDITLPNTLADTPENTILNYFSILREAANPVKGKGAGCGTIGNATIPYPISYEFLSSQYQKNMPYEKYLKTYENILHINLIKYHQVPGKTENTYRYFVELETIEGTDKETGAFTYYYGFVDLEKVGNQYKITDLHYFGENFLCAPYHGWQWDAQGNVEVRYGEWCKLIKGELKKTQNDYIIRIYFQGSDGYEYCIVFFQLTNGTDLEVAQYRKTLGGNWIPIYMNLEDCLENSIRAFYIKT